MSLHDRRVQRLWTDADTFATSLLVLAIDHYGTEIIDWLPVTLQAEIEEDFDVELPQANLDRLMAGLVLLSTDTFYKSLPDFVAICNVLSGDLYDPAQWDPADASEVAWGITEAALISPPDDDPPFMPEITGYIERVLDQEGILSTPGVLRTIVRESRDVYPDDFSDDPGLYQAVLQFSYMKTEEINRLVHDRLMALTDQLQSLPLRHGDTAPIVQRLKARFAALPNA